MCAPGEGGAEYSWGPGVEYRLLSPHWIALLPANRPGGNEDGEWTIVVSTDEVTGGGDTQSVRRGEHSGLALSSGSVCFVQSLRLSSRGGWCIAVFRKDSLLDVSCLAISSHGGGGSS